MTKGNSFYQIVFEDGTVKRRENVPEKLARSVYIALVFEMLLFKVREVTWGKM